MTARRGRWRGVGAGASRPGVLADVALLGATVVGVAGATAAVVAPAGSAMVRVLAGAAVGYVVTSASRRLPAPAPAPLAWGLLAVAAMASWEIVPRATWWGLPTATTARAFAGGLRSGLTAVTSSAAPWAPAAVLPVVFLAGGLAGVGTASIWVARRRRGRASLLALSPAVALYAGAAALGRSRDTLGWTLALVACSVLFVVTADGAPGRHLRRRAHPLRAAGVSLGLPVLVTVAAGVLLPGSAPPAGSATAAPATVRLGARSLLEDVPRVETQLAGDVMFVATTSQPSYWQVATLTRFRSTRWSANPTVLALASDKTSSAPVRATGEEPSGRTALTAHITLRSYTGALLPALPATTRVVGRHVARQDGLVVDTANGAAVHYETTAPGASLPGHGPLIGGAVAPVGTVAADLARPAVPARVAALARRLVAGVPGGPLAEAQALQQWLTSGRFHYSLGPSAASQASVSAFLFTTRTGSCVQFAGAFAVLARLDGLPTRLAVGFTPGTPVGHDRFVVDGADAHVWPEVYLGPQTGWDGFEPTPSASSLPAATGGSPPGRDVSAAPTSHSPHPAAATAAGSASKESSTEVAPVLVAAALAVLLVAAAVLLGRRRRGNGRPPTATASEPGGGPDRMVLAEWHRANVALGTVGLGRAASEGLREHAERVRQAADRGATGPRRVDGDRPPTASTPADAYAELLTLVGRSCYSAAGCGPDDAARARTLADVVTRSVEGARRPTPAGRR